MKGRRIERIELITAGDYHAVSIRFEGKVTLHLNQGSELEPYAKLGVQSVPCGVALQILALAVPELSKS
jgi:hypothetical protein